MKATYVYVRWERQRPPPAQLNEGPYAIVSWDSKTFKLQMGCKEVMVSVGHLKPNLGLASLQTVDHPLRGPPSSEAAP
jgi:hypothetical protein